MFDVLLQGLHYQHTFYEEAEIACRECEDWHLSFDILDDVYRCENCESVFTAADTAAE